MDIALAGTLYLISLPLFFAIDLLWLGVIAKRFYRERLAGLMGDINWPAALIFYGLFLVGLTIFATYPAATEPNAAAWLWGGLFGFFTYATYDLTNLATLRGWPLPVAIVDIIWGTILGAAVAELTLQAYQLFG